MSQDADKGLIYRFVSKPRCRGLGQGLASLPLLPAPNSDSAIVKMIENKK